jgi:hypothetical protein
MVGLKGPSSNRLFDQLAEWNVVSRRSREATMAPDNFEACPETKSGICFIPESGLSVVI